jgi:hypothetical protein
LFPISPEPLIYPFLVSFHTNIEAFHNFYNIKKRTPLGSTPLTLQPSPYSLLPSRDLLFSTMFSFEPTPVSVWHFCPLKLFFSGWGGQGHSWVVEHVPSMGEAMSSTSKPQISIQTTMKPPRKQTNVSQCYRDTTS